MILLEIRNLGKYFGGLAAIVDLNLDVYQGEILGLIGPNGAGKSTVFNVISGRYPRSAGTWIFRGEDITGLPPHRIVQKGIAQLFQANILFKNFTLVENVVAASYLNSGIGFWGSFWSTSHTHKREKAQYEKALEILEFVGLSHKKEETASLLSQGHQRLLGLAIALAPEPKLILLDEPVTGMNAEEVKIMLDMIRKLRSEREISFVLVEHNMRAVMNLCDRIAVLSYGKKIAEGMPKEIANNRAVIEAYLGAEE
jgi:branched-chain amino acid transport system ATP-binding protein